MKTNIATFVLCMIPLTGFSQTLTTSSEYGLPLMNHLTEIYETGTLSKFDNNLGTLTGASLVIYGSGEFWMRGENKSSQGQTAIIESNLKLTFSSSETAVDSLIFAQQPAINLTRSTPDTTYAVNQIVYKKGQSLFKEISCATAGFL